jgi:hypothetical protein
MTLRVFGLALLALLYGCNLSPAPDLDPVPWSAAPADARVWAPKFLAAAEQSWGGNATFDLYPSVFSQQQVAKHIAARNAFAELGFIRQDGRAWTLTDLARKSSAPCLTPYLVTGNCRRFIVGRVVDVRPTSYLFNPNPYPNKAPGKTLTFDYRIEPTTPIGKLLAAQDALACANGKHVTTAADGSTSTQTLFAIWHANTRCDESFSEFGGVAGFHPVGPSLPW